MSPQASVQGEDTTPKVQLYSIRIQESNLAIRAFWLRSATTGVFVPLLLRESRYAMTRSPDSSRGLLSVMMSAAALDAVHLPYGCHADVEYECRFVGTERNKPVLVGSQRPLVMAENSLDVAEVAKGHRKPLVRRCRADARPQPSASP